MQSSHFVLKPYAHFANGDSHSRSQERYLDVGGNNDFAKQFLSRTVVLLVGRATMPLNITSFLKLNGIPTSTTIQNRLTRLIIKLLGFRMSMLPTQNGTMNSTMLFVARPAYIII